MGWQQHRHVNVLPNVEAVRHATKLRREATFGALTGCQTWFHRKKCWRFLEVLCSLLCLYARLLWSSGLFWVLLLGSDLGNPNIQTQTCQKALQRPLQNRTTNIFKKQKNQNKRTKHLSKVPLPSPERLSLWFPAVAFEPIFSWWDTPGSLRRNLPPEPKPKRLHAETRSSRPWTNRSHAVGHEHPEKAKT